MFGEQKAVIPSILLGSSCDLFNSSSSVIVRGGRGVSSEAWDQVSMIAPVKKYGRARLSTGL